MSEESDNQQPLETEQAPTRRRRPSRRGGRGRGARSSQDLRNESDAPETAQNSSDDHRETANHEAAGEAAERMTTSESNASTAQRENGGAGEVAAETMTENMALGNSEATTELAPGDSTQVAPQQERRFRERDRDRDRDRRQDNYNNGDDAQREPEFGEGIIEISGKGFGFLRDAKRHFVQTPQDIFVTPEIVRRFGLRDGMWIYGETRRGSRGPQLVKLLKINGEEPAKYQGLTPFEELTTINPNKRIKLETVPERYTTRIMDLMTPLGMGQRGLIV